MDEKDFSLRLAQLREKKGVSARDMSLSMGQNPGYINNIELGKSMPSLSGFLYICDYLGVTPRDFFDMGAQNPSKVNEIVADLKHLDDRQLDAISTLIKVGLSVHKESPSDLRFRRGFLRILWVDDLRYHSPAAQ